MVRGQKLACQMKKWENFLSFFNYRLLGSAKVQGDRKALPLKAESMLMHFDGARVETCVSDEKWENFLSV